MALFQLSGCSGAGNQQTYIGWQCSGQKNSDNWRCEQREIHHGVATRVVAAGAGQQPGDAASDNSERAVAEPTIARRDPTVVIFENGVRPKDWREQLPGLSAAEAAQPTTRKPAAAIRKDQRATPEPEPAYPNWADEANDKGVGDPADSGGAPQDAGQEGSVTVATTAAVPPALSRTDVPSTPPAASPSHGGYTVQLGAFGNAAQLNAFVEERNLTGLAYRQGIATAASGRTLRVLLWGQFDTAAEATAAWQRETRHYPAVNDYWVRPLAAIAEPSE